MKFWQRIYIFSLILFISTFNVAGILIVEKTFEESLKREVTMCLGEHLSMCSAVNLSMPVYNTLKRYSRYTLSDDEIIYNVVSDYSTKNKLEENEIYIEVLDLKKNIIYRNVNIELPEIREELTELNETTRKYIIRDINEKSYIFISNLLVNKSNNSKYNFTYIKNISNVYEEKQQLYFFFIKLDIVVSFIFVVFMYFISKYITKPIRTLTNATQRIAGGEFSEKVKICGHDEVGILSENFNIMSTVINEKIEELKNINEEKQRFINDLSHELKTPLTSIIGYADLLRATKYDEKIYSEGLDYIVKEGKRLEQLSYKLMNLTLLKKENYMLKSENIKNTINEVVKIEFPKLNNKNIKLIVMGEDFINMQDNDLIVILLSNFIDNAIKASFNNSEIHIILNKDNRMVQIKDFGIGISKEHLEKIFEPFYMVDKSRSRENNGAGLGLSICKKIMDINQITFDIESVVNEGTTISLFFNKRKGGAYSNDI